MTTEDSPAEPPATLDMTALNRQEQDVLGNIAIGFDQHHPREALLRLAEAGYITGHRQTGDPTQTVHWTVPVNIHIQWADWCAAQP